MADVQASRQKLYFHVVLFTVTLGPLLFGYHLGELNAPSEVITCQKKSIRQSSASLPQCIHMSLPEFGLVQSIFTLGGLIGALAAGPVSSKRGRILAMRITSIPTIIGPLIGACASNVGVLAFGRFLGGLGAGASLVVVPIYISEIALQESKGFYGAFTQIMVNGGIFIAQSVGYFWSHDSMWRFILALAGLIGILQAAALLFTVESPKWLAERGRWQEARSALERLRGQSTDIDNEIKGWDIGGNAQSTMDEDPERSPLLGAIGEESMDDRTKDSGDLGFMQVLASGRYRPALLAILIVMASQQLTGINSIVMYGVSLLSSLLSSSSALLNIFVSLLNIFATAGFAPLSDKPKLGRKGVLLGSIAGMSVSSILLGIAIRAEIKILSAICVLTFVASFAFGLGPVPFMLASELVDVKGVSATQSWALAGNWIATFLVAQFFPVVNEALGKGNVYFLFAVLGSIFFASVLWFVPETRGKKGMGEVWGFAESQAVHAD